jgi:hypothetical protein
MIHDKIEPRHEPEVRHAALLRRLFVVSMTSLIGAAAAGWIIAGSVLQGMRQ